MSSQFKKQLRIDILKQRRLLSQEARRQAESDLVNALEQSKLWHESEHIGCYLASPDELNTTRLIQRAINLGKKISVPVITAPGVMKFVQYRVGEQCKIHPRYLVKEPSAIKPDVSSSLDLLIIPAVAIDVNQHRLGYGGGYYDRFLQKHPQLHTRTIAIAFQCCYCESIMPEVHDQKMAFSILV